MGNKGTNGHRAAKSGGFFPWYGTGDYWRQA